MEFNAIDRKKPMFRIGDQLFEYLSDHSRIAKLPVSYSDLLHFDGSIPQVSPSGAPTLWNTVVLRPQDQVEIHEHLVALYQLLVADGGMVDHLQVAGIDHCTYGNSQPFRIKILNKINDNHDYYYIKRADASRVYGAELEHMLSPNRINYILDRETLVEEHIIGVPGDVFIQRPEQYGGHLNPVRLSKEFVKFNERCFVRLLGDMRAYNFVVDVIHDVDQVQYRLRSIDFDQQSYEGRHRIYLPQFYKENVPFVTFAQQFISSETALQYATEERALMRRRYHLVRGQLRRLLSIMELDRISTEEHVDLLGRELARFHQDEGFLTCDNMGKLLWRHLHVRLAIDPSAPSDGTA
ncbi:MAG: hypothetical protein KDB88_09535 [Flavobacteriales bacterium]|nr:hypothetical protein [Flavobacteriales bacterium]